MICRNENGGRFVNRPHDEKFNFAFKTDEYRDENGGNKPPPYDEETKNLLCGGLFAQIKAFPRGEGAELM